MLKYFAEWQVLESIQHIIKRLDTADDILTKAR